MYVLLVDNVGWLVHLVWQINVEVTSYKWELVVTGKVFVFFFFEIVHNSILMIFDKYCDKYTWYNLQECIYGITECMAETFVHTIL